MLILGPAGAGKTRAARFLHEQSGRSQGPLVSVHPAALSPTLLEAELFGFEVGAFTGAERARPGRFRAAEGGTLVLEGVEDLPLPLQVKLLRVLQERVVEPLGSESPIPIDVRIVATCRTPLGDEVRAGRFREDLLYRLAVVDVEVPPLARRLDDLPELIRVMGDGVLPRGTARPFSREALQRLRTHDWPGNLAELESLLIRVHALGSPGDPVGAEELIELADGATDPHQRIAREVLDAGLTLAEVEAALIEEALLRSGGNSSAAARALGITRRAIDYRRAKGEGDQ